MAKSLEDTAFYRYPRLIALNEVGGEPAHPALSVASFHRAQARLREEMPYGLIATATHDTKRGEDARMRILALAEIPEQWAEAVARWRQINAPLVWSDGKARSPTANHEYMLYQTLIGAWPVAGVHPTFIERIQAYAVKAAREGKRSTSWTDPQERYEKRLTEFVGSTLDPAVSSTFIESISALAQRTALIGALNSLSQLVLKLMLPGVPDFFQGTELWDLALVDPDNRRPVDFGLRRGLLDDEREWPELVDNWPNGRVKMRLMQALLRIRQEFAALFRDGNYAPLAIDGADANRVIGFSRTHKRQRLLVLVRRHFAAATDAGRHWPDAPDISIKDENLSGYRNLLEPGAGGLFSKLPAAVLVRGGPQ